MVEAEQFHAHFTGTVFRGLAGDTRHIRFVDEERSTIPINATALDSRSNRMGTVYAWRKKDILYISTAVKGQPVLVDEEIRKLPNGLCAYLEEISFDSAVVRAQDLSGLFTGYRKLRQADLSSFVFTETASINSLFGDCVSLEKVSFGSSLLKDGADTNFVFNNCDSLLMDNIQGLENIRPRFNTFFGYPLLEELPTGWKEDLIEHCGGIGKEALRNMPATAFLRALGVIGNEPISAGLMVDIQSVYEHAFTRLRLGKVSPDEIEPKVIAALEKTGFSEDLEALFNGVPANDLLI